MARKRYNFQKRRRSSRSVSTRSRGSSRGRDFLGIGRNVPKMIGGAVYGGVRARVSSFLSSKIPNFLGEFTDEAVMLAISLAVESNVKQPILREAGNAGIYIESARIGETLANKMFSGSTSSSSTSF
jgi:hypothetical protein